MYAPAGAGCVERGKVAQNKCEKIVNFGGLDIDYGEKLR